MRGARRAAAKANNARLRIALRPRDARGRLLPMNGAAADNAAVAEAAAEVAEIAAIAFAVTPAAMVDADAIETFVNDSHGDTHAHTDCVRLAGRTFTVDAAQTGWMCEICIHVATPAWIASHNVAPSHGSHGCNCCGTTKPMRSFPTIVVGGDGGWRMRGNTCRKCEKAARSAIRESFADAA